MIYKILFAFFFFFFRLNIDVYHEKTKKIDRYRSLILEKVYFIINKLTIYLFHEKYDYRQREHHRSENSIRCCRITFIFVTYDTLFIIFTNVLVRSTSQFRDFSFVICKRKKKKFNLSPLYFHKKKKRKK